MTAPSFYVSMYRNTEMIDGSCSQWGHRSWWNPRACKTRTIPDTAQSAFHCWDSVHQVISSLASFQDPHSFLLTLCFQDFLLQGEVKALTRIFRKRGSNWYPSFTTKSLHAKLKYELVGSSLGNSPPSATGQEKIDFGYTLFHLCIPFVASGTGSAWRGLPVSLSPSHMKRGEGRRALLPLSGLHTFPPFSRATWALPCSAAQCSSGHPPCPLNSILSTSKYTNVFQSLDGETYGNFRFSLKLTTNKYCWADETLQVGSLQLHVLLLDYLVSHVIP